MRSTTTPRHRAGLTLIEVVVVCGIIATLVALVMPLGARAREAGRRARCAANLHAIWAAAQAFANDNGGFFPASYRMPDGSYPFRFPNVISTNPNLSVNMTTWQTYGTPWQALVQYGGHEGVWDCPSSETGLRQFPVGAAPKEWGPIVWTDYMYLAGLTHANRGKSLPFWGSAVPAVTIRDDKAPERVVAADMVFYSGGPDMKWDATRRYRINHARPGDPTRPDFQAILYADGHIDGRGREWYERPLNTTDNYSLQHAPAPVGGFFYWGPGQTGKTDPPAVSASAKGTAGQSWNGVKNNMWTYGTGGPPTSNTPPKTTPPPPPPPPPPSTPPPPPAPAILPNPLPG